MRNRYGGICYRCGKWCEPGDGHFERIDNRGWRVQHASCAIEHRGTDKNVWASDVLSEAPTHVQPVNVMKPPRNEHGQLLCSYCGQPAKLHETSDGVYNGRDYGPVYACTDCGAWVGCHPGGKKALGRLANKELRLAKMDAHAAFDRLWKAKADREMCRRKEARGAGYKWLAAQLGIDVDVCHIGYMDVEACRRVVDVCRPYLQRLED